MDNYTLIDQLRRMDIRGHFMSVGLYSRDEEDSAEPAYRIVAQTPGNLEFMVCTAELWEDAYGLWEEMCEVLDVAGTPVPKKE